MLQADHVVDERRGRMRDLRGEEDGKLSFADAVLAAATRLRPHDAPAVQLKIDGNARQLDPTMREEALANAYHHADAQHIELELHYGARELRCIVRDDGAGIAPEIMRDGGHQHHWVCAACTSARRGSRPNWCCAAAPTAAPNGSWCCRSRWHIPDRGMEGAAVGANLVNEHQGEPSWTKE